MFIWLIKVMFSGPLLNRSVTWWPTVYNSKFSSRNLYYTVQTIQTKTIWDCVWKIVFLFQLGKDLWFGHMKSRRESWRRVCAELKAVLIVSFVRIRSFPPYGEGLSLLFFWRIIICWPLFIYFLTFPQYSFSTLFRNVFAFRLRLSPFPSPELSSNRNVALLPP